MKRRLLPLLILFAACATQPQNGPVKPLSIGDYTGDVGPSPVGVIPSATLHDAQRNEDLNVSIEYPTRGGPFPVIVFSHAYGLTEHDYEPLVSYWVSNGYVVIRPGHADAGVLKEQPRDTLRDIYRQQAPRSRREEGRRRTAPSQQQQQPAPPPAFRPNPMEAIWDKEREPQWRNRVADVKLVLDSLGDLVTRFPELQDKIDRTKIGVAGHSYGAFTAMLIGGVQTFSTPPLQLADPRVKAIIAMSPQGTAENRGLTPQSFATLHIPAMFMTGSEDRGAVQSEDANWRKQAFDDSPAPDKYFVLLLGARGTSFTGSSSAAFTVSPQAGTYPATNPNPMNPTLPQQPAGPGRATPMYITDNNLFQKIKLTSLIFWDAYLKGETPARDLLTQDKMPGGVTLLKK